MLKFPMPALIRQILSSPRLMFGLIAAVSAFSLAAALTGQFAFDLKPCSLCLYQRVPFIAAFALAAAGLCLKKEAAPALLSLCALAFLINAGIAFYHTGVELNWWASGVEGCAVPPMGNNPEEWISKILSNPAVPCSDIQWKDPVLSLTMANYNVVLCLGMFAACAASAVLIRPRPSR